MSKKAVASRRLSRAPDAHLAAIIESSDDAIIGKNLDGTITSWNHGAEQIFGYSPNEVIGRPITLLIPADRLAEEAEILQRLRRGERVDHFETVRVAKNGRKVDVSVTISPVLDENGKVIGASKIARDITEKKRVERELKQAHLRLQNHAEELEQLVAARTAELRDSLEELETFSSSLSHDLRAPLRAIAGYTTALQEEYASELPAEGRELARRAVDSCGRLSRLVDNVLAYTRLRSGRLELTEVDLAQLVPAVLEHYPHAKQARAEVRIEGELLPVWGNEGLLTQVVANLVSNAVKFVSPGTRPSLRICAERRGEWVRLSIQDNGIGIPQADQEKVFGLFTRLHGQDRYEGTGVGLAVVQRAVRRLGGNVGVNSEEGKGSTFWIELKAVQSRPGASRLQA